jgi:hypothetical protein
MLTPISAAPSIAASTFAVECDGSNVVLVVQGRNEEADHFITPTQADQLAARLVSMANRVRRAG